MKKVLMLLVVLSVAITSRAQFEHGKHYIQASLTGFNLNYCGADDLNIGIEARGGYLFNDNWMLLAQIGWQHNGNKTVADEGSLGVGGRYYIIQNGLYLGVNVKYVHNYHSYNDFMPGIEVGYAFFVSKTVTFEPAVYYDQSFTNHSDYSRIGLRIGVGVYL